MPFDFSLVSAPFRMQPGLRRVAPGAAQLTPSAPGSRHLREKTAVLASFAEQALRSTSGIDEPAILRTIAGEAARTLPRRLRRGKERRRPTDLRRAPTRLDARERRPDRCRRSGPRRRAGRAPGRVAPERPAFARLRRGLRRHRRRQRDDPVAGRVPAVALGAGRKDRPPLRRGPRAGRRQRDAGRSERLAGADRHRRPTAGSASSGRSAPTRTCTSIRRAVAPTGRPPTRRRLRRSSRWRPCEASARPSSRSPRAARPSSRSTSRAFRSPTR